MTRRRTGERSRRFSAIRNLRFERLELRRVLATFLVNTVDDVVDSNDGLLSLREAVEFANTQAGSDEIRFDDALFTARERLELTLGQLRVTESLIVTGQGLHLTTLAGSGTSRLFLFESVSGDLTLQDLTLRDGRTIGDDVLGSNSGGAVHFASSGVLQLDRVALLDNQVGGQGSRGGALFLSGGDLVLNESAVSGNATAGLDGRGGAIYSSGAITIQDSKLTGNQTLQEGARGGAIVGREVTIHRSTLTGNSTSGQSSDGGALFVSHGLTLTESSVTGNQTLGEDSDGGAIFASGTLVIERSDLSGNRTQGHYAGGGAIAMDNASLTVTQSSVTGNRTAGHFSYGPGLFVVRSGVTITNSTLSTNVGEDGTTEGGALASFFSDVELIHTTVAHNTVAGQGGGVAFMDNEGRKLRLVHSIVAENEDDGTAPDLLVAGSIPAISATGSLVGENAGSGLVESQTADSNGNLIGSISGAGRMDPGLGGLRSVGQTLLHPLLEGSVAIDAVTDTFPFALSNDQRGNPFARNVGLRPDMGAVESQSLDVALLHVTTASDEFDFGDDAVSLREAVAAANGTVAADVITFDHSLAGQHLTITRGEIEVVDSVRIVGTTNERIRIDGEQNSRLFHLHGNKFDVTLEQLEFAGGRTLANDEPGGAILALNQGMLELLDVDFFGNSTHGDSSPGGAVHSTQAVVAVEQSRWESNLTTGDASAGGALSAPAVLASASSFEFNQTFGEDADGGAIRAFGFEGASSLDLMTSTIAQNETHGLLADGGGLAIVGEMNLQNSTISGNLATGDGGGLVATDLSSSTHAIHATTIVENHSAADGGGLLVGIAGDLQVWNSVVASNTAGSSSPDLDATSVSGIFNLRSSLVGDNAGSGLSESLVPDAAGNRIGSAAGSGILQPQVKELAFRGGTTRTHVPRAGSPLIDAADPSLVQVQTDQRGVPFARVFGPAPDIGAFELQALPTSALIVNTVQDELDFSNSHVSLREALVLSDGGDGIDVISFDPEVFVSEQTITLTMGALTASDAVTIAGPNASRVSIDAGGMSRVFEFPHNVDIRLENLTLTGGRTQGDNVDSFDATSSGGAVWFVGDGDLTLQGVEVHASETMGQFASGGGIYFRGEQLLIAESFIRENVTHGDDARGGGLFIGGGNAEIIRSEVTGNVTSGDRSAGAGIAILDASVTINESSIMANGTSGVEALGAGVFVDQASVIADGVTVSENSTTGTDASGGGIALVDGDLFAFNATISTNRVTSGSGAGLLVGAGSESLLVHATVVSNVAGADGGGIFVVQGGVESLSLRNSIVAENADEGTAPDLNRPLGAGNLVLQATLIGDGSGAGLSESQTPDVLGNLIGDSGGAGVIDPILGTLAFRGGPTLTHEPLNGSLAIGAGRDEFSTDLLGNPLLTDQRGAPFIRRFGTVDMGAFEVQPPREPLIEWPDPENIFVGTPLGDSELNASTDVPGSFVYTPSRGTVLSEGDNQVLTVTFTPSDRLHYRTATLMASIDVVPTADLGDAPDSYGTLRDSDGASHLESSFRLGGAIDFETDGQPSPEADADDRMADDEDGVTFLSSIVVPTQGTSIASVQVEVNRRSKLDAWIDFNGDGVFQPGAEHLGQGTSMDVVGGANIISFEVPSDAIAGITHARFRLSSDGNLLPTGEAPDGEVEDYVVTLLDGAQLPTVQALLPRGSFTMSRSGADLLIQGDGDLLFRANANDIGSYQIRGSDFSNVLTIDQSMGNALPAAGLEYDAVKRVNTLRWLGLDGRVDLSGSNLRFQNLDVIDIGDPFSTTVVLEAAAVRAMDPDRGGVVVVGESGDVVEFADSPNWRMGEPIDVAGFVFRVANTFGTFVQFDFGSPWQNAVQPSDVNNDGTATAADALRIINELSRRNFSDGATGLLAGVSSLNEWPDLFFDQNGDGAATALDALRVINDLARSSNVAGEEIIGARVTGEGLANATGWMAPHSSIAVPQQYDPFPFISFETCEPERSADPLWDRFSPLRSSAPHRSVSAEIDDAMSVEDWITESVEEVIRALAERQDRVTRGVW